MNPRRKFGGFTYDFLQEHLPQLIADMEMAANRVAKIVADLKNFSRQSNLADKAPARHQHRGAQRPAPVPEHPAQGRSRPSSSSWRTDLPEIEGNLQNLEQVVLNIVINAAQAIDHAARGNRRSRRV
ncbi:MAG: hypothetical protein MZV70_63070 [Desulfobacterales bacterium]|nr:hypothetical protein [Desulfobacterales bacterium]